MHPYLMHSSSKWFAKYHTSCAILGKLLERRRTILTLWRYFANANLVADHFNGFLTLHYAPKNDQFWLLCFQSFFIYLTYSGNTPSTLQIYSFSTCRLRICCSIWRAFFGLRPNNKSPEVNRSSR